MNNRNIFVEGLFKAVKDEKLTTAERRHLIVTAISKKVNIDLKDETGETALIWSVTNGHPEMTHLLLEAKANPHIPSDISDTTPLLWAVFKNSPKMTCLLLAAKANPNVLNRIQGSTPLTFILSGNTISEAQTKIVHLLLKNKADPEMPAKTEAPPLNYAIQRGHIEMAHLLLKARANPGKPDKKGMTPLHWAAHEGQTEIGRALLEAKANPDVRLLDKAAASPLSIALSKGRTEIASLLLEALAGMGVLDKPAMLACAINQKDLPLIILLFQQGARISISKFAVLHTFLASQDQGHPAILTCLKALNSPHNLALMPSREDALLYMEKLRVLHAVFAKLYSFLMGESTAHLPHVVKELVLNYEDRHYQPRSKIMFFQPASVDPALTELKAEILEKTTSAPELFDKTIQEINAAIKLRK